MGDWAGRPAFSVGRRNHTWAEVWSVARASGAWRALEAEVRAGMALRDAGLAAARAEVKAEADAFRRARKLHAAEDAEAWLAARELTVADWQDHLQRAVLCRNHPAPATRRAVKDAPELLATGWCSGAFEDMAQAAAVKVIGADRWSPSSKEVGQLVERRRLDWVAVRARMAVFRNEDAAREAVQCIVADGMSLDEVAKLAKARLELWEGVLEDLGNQARSKLLPAVAGDVVGPVAHGEGAAVYLVEEKVLPSVKDEAIASRARRLLQAQAVERALAEDVVWHAPS